jgi:hypothetical protein
MDPNGGNLKRRVIRIEEIMEVLTSRHIDLEEDHARLLKAQVVMADQLQKNSAQIDRLTATQDRTDAAIAQLTIRLDTLGARVDALVSAVGEFIRRLPPPQ